MPISAATAGPPPVLSAAYSAAAAYEVASNVRLNMFYALTDLLLAELICDRLPMLGRGVVILHECVFEKDHWWVQKGLV